MISRLRIFLAASILILPFILPTSGFAMQGISGTFFQPTNAMKTWDNETWDTLFNTYRCLGLSEIIVQWVVYEDTSDNYEKPTYEYDLSVISKIMEHAEQNGMDVTIGGVFLNSFWKRIETDPELIKVHLMRIRKGTAEAIKRIAPQLQCSPAFAGWYVSQEIDDRTWLDKNYTDILCSFIKDLHGDLSTLVPNKPMSISAFSNGWASPERLGQFWRTVADTTGVGRVLFQDGVGVKKLTVKEVPLYLKKMQEEMQGACCTLQPVVEIFTQLEGDKFTAEPAPLKRIREQLHEELPFAPNGVMLFSVAEYMSPIGGEKAEALLQEVLHNK
ncbi:DUF4434 domain-containing protein [Halodesulfovibrio aestuarii]|uniref:DUF4434 domain-containing protein n=1 Tax=Halodesulfovibrio aestuarii TaxID=126333 RepID=A0ABV4JVH3_9BACT